MSTNKIVKAILIVLSALVTMVQAADEVGLFLDNETEWPL